MLRLDSAIERIIVYYLRPSAMKLRGLLVVVALLHVTFWYSHNLVAASEHVGATEQASATALGPEAPTTVPRPLLQIGAGPGAVQANLGGASSPMRAAWAVAEQHALARFVRSACCGGSQLFSILAEAAVFVALLSWHVLALAAAILFSLLATYCQIILALTWTRLLLAGSILLRSWLMNLGLIIALWFAFGALRCFTPLADPGPIALSNPVAGASLGGGACVLPRPPPPHDRFTAHGGCRAPHAEITAPADTLDTPLSGQDGVLQHLVFRAVHAFGVDPLVGARIVAAASMQRKKRS